MAQLKVYVVTNTTNEAKIKQAIVEKINKNAQEVGTDTYALTLTKNGDLYMFFCDSMVAKDVNLTSNMIKVNQKVDTNAVLNNMHTVFAPISVSSDIVRLQSTIDNLNSKINNLETLVGRLSQQGGSGNTNPGTQGSETPSGGKPDEDGIIDIGGGTSEPSGSEVNPGSGEQTPTKPEQGGSGTQEQPTQPEHGGGSKEPEQDSPIVNPEPEKPSESASSKFYMGQIETENESWNWDTYDNGGGFSSFDFLPFINSTSNDVKAFDYNSIVGTGTPITGELKSMDSFIWFAFEKGSENLEFNTDPNFNGLAAYPISDTKKYEITKDFGIGEKTYTVLITSDYQQSLPAIYVRAKQ